MGEVAIFLGRLLQAVDDAMDPAAVAVTVLLGKFRHPLAAHTDPKPNGHATLGLLRHQRGDQTIYWRFGLGRVIPTPSIHWNNGSIDPALNPEGSQRLAGGRAQRAHRLRVVNPREHPGGVPE
jgi:hypothetical protein